MILIKKDGMIKMIDEMLSLHYTREQLFGTTLQDTLKDVEQKLQKFMYDKCLFNLSNHKGTIDFVITFKDVHEIEGEIP